MGGAACRGHLRGHRRVQPLPGLGGVEDGEVAPGPGGPDLVAGPLGEREGGLEQRSTLRVGQVLRGVAVEERRGGPLLGGAQAGQRRPRAAPARPGPARWRGGPAWRRRWPRRRPAPRRRPVRREGCAAAGSGPGGRRVGGSVGSSATPAGSRACASSSARAEDPARASRATASSAATACSSATRRPVSLPSTVPGVSPRWATAVEHPGGRAGPPHPGHRVVERVEPAETGEQQVDRAVGVADPHEGAQAGGHLLGAGGVVGDTVPGAPEGVRGGVDVAGAGVRLGRQGEGGGRAGVAVQLAGEHRGQGVEHHGGSRPGAAARPARAPRRPCRRRRRGRAARRANW